MINANASEELRELAASDRFPVTSTLMGLGAFPASGENWLGMLGMHGTYTANTAMDKADLIVAIGARFDDRITGKLDEFAPHAKIIHIDIDPAEISKNVGAHIPIVGDVKLVLPKLTREYRALQTDSSRLDAWWKPARAPGSRSTRSSTSPARTARSSPSSWSRRCTGRPRATRSSPPTSASTRCGRPSTTASTSRAAGSTPAASARWASACRRRSAPRSPAPTSTSSASPATAA